LISAIGKSYSFAAAHRLWRDDWDAESNRRAFNRCVNLHGHSYTVEVELVGQVNPETGMVCNYYEMDRIIKPIVDVLDHGELPLHEYFTFLPTAENIADWFFQQLIAFEWPNNARVSRVRVKESEKTYAETLA